MGLTVDADPGLRQVRNEVAPVTTPLFLHFLNREMLRALDLPSLPHVEASLRTLVLAHCGELYASLSFIWENQTLSDSVLHLIGRLDACRQLELLADEPSLDDFISARQATYSSDSIRYPGYFNGVEKLREFQPTLYKGEGATTALSESLVGWGSPAMLRLIERLSHRDLLLVGGQREAISRAVESRDMRAITMSLFDPARSRSFSPQVRRVVGRLLTGLYIEHYLDFIDGDILTGIPLLSYYDSCSRLYPLFDYELLSFLGARLGFKRFFEGDQALTEIVIDRRGSPEQWELCLHLQAVVDMLCSWGGVIAPLPFDVAARSRLRRTMRSLSGLIRGRKVLVKDYPHVFEIGAENTRSTLARLRLELGNLSDSTSEWRAVPLSRRNSILGVRGAQMNAKVFVVSGRDEQKRREIFSLLRAAGLQPLEWQQARRTTGRASPYVGEILDFGLAGAQAIVVLYTPDEEVVLRPDLLKKGERPEGMQFQPRPNVLFEAGLAFGRNPDRTVIVEWEGVRVISDLAGRHVVRYDGSVGSRKELLVRLQDAGCPVDFAGDDWMQADSQQG